MSQTQTRNHVLVMTKDKMCISISKDLIPKITLLKNLCQDCLENNNALTQSEDTIIPLDTVESKYLNFTLEILECINKGQDTRSALSRDKGDSRTDIQMAEACFTADFLECTEVLDVLLMHLANKYLPCIEESRNVIDASARQQKLQEGFEAVFRSNINV